MKCQRCASERILSTSAKCSDCFSAVYQSGMDNEDRFIDGYVPTDLNVGGGDYMEVRFCLECGQIQGEFPISEEVVKETFGNAAKC